jgi:GNAT superfamily N-acetyltransferase
MIGKTKAKMFLQRFLSSRVAAREGYKLAFFRSWHPRLDEALKELPEVSICSHELFRLLAQNPGPSEKPIILVTERGSPVAVVGLRRVGSCWEPVTQWILPGFLFPVREGCIGRVLAALGCELHIGWWRWKMSPPEISGMRDATATPTHGMLCSDDFEQYWRKNGNWKDVRLYRNRCKGFEMRLDEPGSLEFTIRHWEARWRPSNVTVMPDLEDRVIVATSLERLGFSHTLSLFDEDRMVASLSFTIHNNEAVAHYNYRNPEYNWHGVMTRLIEAGFYWARDRGFRKVDLGGSFEYKAKWAPENGEKWEFTVCPGYMKIGNQAAQLLPKARSKLNMSFKRFGSRVSVLL